MKMADIARVTIKRLFKCQCCTAHVDSLSVAIVGDTTVVCKECAVKVALHEQNLLTAFKMINNGNPISEEDREMIRRMSLNIKFDVPVPDFVVSEVI